MKLRIIITLSFILFIIATLFFALADTGTYRILDYTVKLTPRSDGKVEMVYYQKWLVTGGHIPWITIGLPNSSYQLDSSKNRGNIRRIQPNNSSNWSGVRIDLDKDYLPEENFEVGFSLIQSRLFYADEDNYRLDFTPGWYDRAITERLAITMHVFAPIDQVTATPRPSRIEGQEMTWEKLDLGEGERFSVSISFPKKFMPQAEESALRGRLKFRSPLRGFILFFLFSIFGIIIIIAILASRIGYGRGGRIFYGGAGRGAGGLFGGRTTGGGGGFGGRSTSCACACVSCACACACAGGGGAGCSKKANHTCPICAEEKNIQR